MASEFKWTGLDEVRKALAVAPDIMFKAARKGLRNSSIDFEREMIGRMSAGLPPSASPTDGVSQRTGALKRSIQRRVKGTSIGTLELTIGIGGANAPHAIKQEIGGTITPSRGQFLAIPVGPSVTQTGKRRYSNFSQLHANTFLTPRRGGPGWNVLQRIGKKIQLVAVLVPSVTLRPLLGFQKTWKKHVPKIFAEVDRELTKALKRAFRKGANDFAGGV